MPCFRPLTGYWSRVKNHKGNRYLVFNAADGYLDRPVTVACGQCMGCRWRKTRDYAIRNMHEASLHEEKYFLTLTFSSMPPNASAETHFFQRFMKRYRKALGDQKVRYFACGEYGGKTGRPHYHALIYGHRPDDLVPISRRGPYPLYTSPEIQNIWKQGHISIGEISFTSAAYTATYCQKKVTGKRLEVINPETKLKPYELVDERTGEIFKRKPEWVAGSKELGVGYVKEFVSDVFPRDYVVMDGKRLQTPAYYYRKLRDWDEELHGEVRRKRRKSALEIEADFEALARSERWLETYVDRKEHVL